MSKKKYPEFLLLSEFLEKENVSEKIEIDFNECSSRDNRYALTVSSPLNTELVTKLAEFFGCPEADLPKDEPSFEACDTWHCAGQGNLRDLADEMAQYNEPFFDLTISVAEIHEIAKS